MPKGYSVAQYAAMVNCEPRMAGYVKALEAAITPGCTVFDIGAGFGILSLLACKFGAGKVIAIEPDASIELLHDFARDNGYLDRISIISDLSSNYHPQFQADVIVSDLRGALPLFEGHIEAIIDARQRLLAPGGKLLPQYDMLRAAVANVPMHYQACEKPWVSNAYGLDLAGGRPFAVNETAKASLTPADLISEPKDLAALDYRTIETADLDAKVELIALRRGRANGIAVWFDADIFQGIGFSNAPGAPNTIYRQTFFPFEREVDLQAGDRVDFSLKARMVQGKYLWSWVVSIHSLATGVPPVTFRHSTFKSKPLSPAVLRKHSSAFVPEIVEAQAIDRFCLAQVDGIRSLDEIADLIVAKFHPTFSERKAALDHVTSLLARYD